MGVHWSQWWGRTASPSPAIAASVFSSRPSPPTSRGLAKYQRLMFRHKLYQLREERDMKPETFASLVSAILYEKRFGPYFTQPVIAGLGDEDKPFICTMDSIGAK
ncbi:hypothetical protein C1H46_045317 [Malus baccata]|uniref:Uncharacterized protein n=1 Tax=Malus baccata TaxID=106549 RepID=A0A540K4M4_MALBA|nr:hypothetical protein C1H46_045317 [Malus baccata]